MLFVILGLVLSIFGLSGCSSVPNTIAGLSTLQSTISGSNYVFFVEPSSGRLTPSLKREELGEPIHAGDYFSVTLDFGFLRYLQAVDPYVIVYSETWMGKNPRPTEGEKTLRQVVLIKEGMAPNSRLPITNFPLLGPVTMGEDLLDVYVTLKVVVLSKNDNAQSIKLVEGLAGTASAAGPQYSALAGAAAATVAAFISQNKDKIEFEHTYVLSPDGSISQGSQRETHYSRLQLREGQLVTLKGESRYRSVPYPNWQYYLYPFNWFGIGTDKSSRKIEKESAPIYGLIGAIVHAPQFIAETIFSTPSPDNPVGLADYSYSPMAALSPVQSQTTIPFSSLGSDGMEIIDCAAIKPRKLTILFGLLGNEDVEYWDHSDKTNGNCRLNVAMVWPNRFESNAYVQKTHMGIRVARSNGSLGTFQELVDHLSEHSKVISEVTTSSSDSRKLTDERIDAAFDSIKEAIHVDRAKKASRDAAKAGFIHSIPEVGKAQPSLLVMQIKETSYHTTRRIIQFAKSKKQGDPNGERLFADVQAYINAQRWNVLNQTSDPRYSEWVAAWKNVIEGVREELSSWQMPAFVQKFDPALWDSLAAGVCQGSLEMPAVSVSDIGLHEGPAGAKKARFTVNVLPKPRTPFNLTAKTVDGTALAGTHYEAVTDLSIPVELARASYPIDVTVHGNSVAQNSVATFHVTLDLPSAEKAKAFLCRGQALGKILDGDGTITSVSPIIEAASGEGQTAVRIKFEFAPPSFDPIELDYKVLPSEAAKVDDFEKVKFTPLPMQPNATSSEEKIMSFPGSTKKVSILVVPRSNNLNPSPIIRTVDVK